jgi:hypothetical protein
MSFHHWLLLVSAHFISTWVLLASCWAGGGVVVVVPSLVVVAHLRSGLEAPRERHSKATTQSPPALILRWGRRQLKRKRGPVRKPFFRRRPFCLLCPLSFDFRPFFRSNILNISLTIQVDCTHWGIRMQLGGSSYSESDHKQYSSTAEQWWYCIAFAPLAPCVLMIANGFSLSSTSPKLLSRCVFTRFLCYAKISFHSCSFETSSYSSIVLQSWSARVWALRFLVCNFPSAFLL